MPRTPGQRLECPPYRVGCRAHPFVGPAGIRMDIRVKKKWVGEEYAGRAAWVEGFAKTFQDLAHEGILSKCIRSMPQRLKDVVAARGGPTKW